MNQGKDPLYIYNNININKVVRLLGEDTINSYTINPSNVSDKINNNVFKYSEKHFKKISRESALAVFLTHLSYSVCSYRISVSSRLIGGGRSGVYPNMYVQLFMRSGAGKDRLNESYRNIHFGKTYNSIESNYRVHTASYMKEYEEKVREELDEDESLTDKKREAIVSERMRWEFPHNFRSVISEGTAEGLYSYAQSIDKVGSGAMFAEYPEWADFLLDEKQSNADLLTSIKKAYDDTLTAKIIKSDKNAHQVEVVPFVLLAYTAFKGLSDYSNRDKIITHLERGYARRSIICLNKYEKEKDPEGEGDELEQYFADKYLRSDRDFISESAIKQHEGSVLSALEQHEGGQIMLTMEADKYLANYKGYCSMVGEESKDSFIRDDLVGRYWKALKLAPLLAIYSHPNDFKVNLEDVKSAVHIIQSYGSFLYEFEEKIYMSNFEEIISFLKENEGKLISRGELREKKYVESKNFKKWFESHIPSMSEILLEEGYELKLEKRGNKKMVGVFKMETTDTENIEITVSDGNTAFTPLSVKWDDLPTVMKNKNYSSTPQYKDNHRNKANASDGQSLIILDYDSGTTIGAVSAFLKVQNLKGCIVTTKSHNIDKGGSQGVEERFRVVIPLLYKFKGNHEDFSEVMRDIHDWVEGTPDQACKDISRFYYPSPKDAEVYQIQGDPLSLSTIPKRVKENVVKRDSNILKTPKTLESKMARYRTKMLNDFQEGNRNNVLYSILRWAKDEGCSNSEVEQVVRSLNAEQLSPESEENLVFMFKSHLK